LLFTQLDKILLARMLTLDAFGYHALAGTVVGALSMVIAPIATASIRASLSWQRVETDCVARGFSSSGTDGYRVRGAIALVLVLFAESTLRVWTGDPVLARTVAPLVAVLSLGTLLYSLIVIPYQLSNRIWLDCVNDKDKYRRCVASGASNFVGRA